MTTPCLNKRRQHQHGDYAHYAKCGCRCTPCTATASVKGKTHRYIRATGRRSYADAAPVRAHLEQLIASGITIMQIAHTTGLNSTALRRILGQQSGQPASKGVRAHTARAILAIRPGQPPVPAVGLVSNVGTRRRIQALATMGWSVSAIAKHAGLDRQPLYRSLSTDRPVSARTAHAIARTYNELWDAPAPSSAYATRARNTAHHNRWAPPAAWDAIDDPNERPQGVLREAAA